MKCTKCDYYSFSLRRCTNGKINPRTRKGAVEAASIMGISYICQYNKWRKTVSKIILTKQYGRDKNVRGVI